MLGDDLDHFFNPDEHAVAATVKKSDGTPVGTFNVILVTPVQDMALVASGSVSQLQPSIQGRTEDLGGVEKEYIVEAGGATYRAVKRANDGTGVSTVWLRKE